jgi:hypothetical protein
MQYILKESMGNSNINTKYESLSEPLPKQDKTITEATRIMSLPGKSTRPLKKRRFVSIESKDVFRAVSKPPKNYSCKSQQTESVDQKSKMKVLFRRRLRPGRPR